jgi:hypothetical protein
VAAPWKSKRINHVILETDGAGGVAGWHGGTGASVARGCQSRFQKLQFVHLYFLKVFTERFVATLPMFSLALGTAVQRSAATGATLGWADFFAFWSVTKKVFTANR